MNNQPLGFYDSGVGGTSVLAELRRRLPGEDVIYVGDTLHLPYGEKTAAELLEYGRQVMDFLLEQNVKGVVFACNTVSAVTMPELKRMYPEVPLVGTIKAGSRGAIQATNNRKIGVISTQNTADSCVYTSTIQNEDYRYQVFEQACPALVPMIERGITDNEELRKALSDYLSPLLKRRIDTLVLGCTHYPFLASLIQELAGVKVLLVDPAVETIKELEDLLLMQGKLHASERPGQYTCYVSGDPVAFQNTLSVLCPGLIDKTLPLAMKG